MTATTGVRVSYGGEMDFPAVDSEVFRHTVARFASGVTVISTFDDGQLFGTTASAVSSLSMEPPMMLICLNRSSRAHDAVAVPGRYAVNILSEHQGDLAHRFARKGGSPVHRRGPCSQPARAPLLDDALATIECVVVDTAAGGTHTVFIGRVLEATAREGEPFGKLERVKEVSAYEGTRQWILARSARLGEVIDVDALAAELRSAPVLANAASSGSPLSRSCCAMTTVRSPGHR